jgi:hypothetical protein
MSTNDTTPTPAPAAVPEGLAHLLENLDCIPGSLVKVGDDYEFWLHSPDQIAGWLRSYWPDVHAPREDAPRPEPVTAPLPSEAVEARQHIDDMLDFVDRQAHALVDRHLAPIVNEFSPHGSERAKFIAVHNAINVGPSLKSATQVIRQSLRALLPADGQRARDEGTVRETRQAVARLTRDVADLRAALSALVRLKDGPRDEAYRVEKDAAWQVARDVLAVNR